MSEQAGWLRAGVYFCACEHFALWYVTEGSGIRVCTCGHPEAAHVDGTRLCTGEVTIEGTGRHELRPG